MNPAASFDPIRLPDVLETEYAHLGLEISPLDGEANQDDPTRLTHIRSQVHQHEPLRALCISGGGIRSATFALGALQGLAKLLLLEQFDYVSTVSGGGYIGSWLSAWIHRAGVDNVSDRLAGRCQPGPCDVDPVEHLREFNSYLTPKLGIGSVDTWTLAAIVVRNLVLNWLLLIPILLCVAMAPRLAVGLFEMEDVPYEGIFDYVVMAISICLFAVANFNLFRYLPSVGNVKHTAAQFLRNLFAPIVLSGILMLTVFWWQWDMDTSTPVFGAMAGWSFAISMATWLVYLTIYQRARFWRLLFGPISLALLIGAVSTGASCYLLTNWLYSVSNSTYFTAFGLPLFMLGPLIGGLLFIGFSSRALEDSDREWSSRVGAYLLQFLFSWLALCLLVLVVPTLVLHAGGWIQSTIAAAGGISGWITSLAGRSAKTGSHKEKPASPWREIAGKLALPVFLCSLLVGLSLILNLILAGLHLTATAWWDHQKLLEDTPIWNSLLLTLVLTGFTTIMARFINTNKFSLHGMYRNRLVRAYLAASNSGRNPNPFTGFDENDNINISDLREQVPLHVTNQALNLVSGKNLAWQQRKAQTFTVTPFHAGNYDLGYRDSKEYGLGISLGTAMTISGAAASPNMGYHSSPLVGFTMMLFNARLGCWLGNPGWAGRDTWQDDGPRTAVGSVVREALGLTDNTGPYVYLSDGGHFENLALYEMVLRRVRTVIVLDSGCDPDLTYEDLGNALRKIRIDFGIPIDFPDEYLNPLRNKQARCAVATIRYSAVDKDGRDGTLLYIKPILLGDEPPDVASYAKSSATFPHETTNDQWFTESQTESYRMLGCCAMEQIARGWTGERMEDFLTHVKENYLRPYGAGRAAGGTI